MDKQLPPIPSRKYFINLKNHEKASFNPELRFQKKTKVKPQPSASIDNIKKQQHISKKNYD
jgi:hypothetical protein